VNATTLLAQIPTLLGSFGGLVALALSLLMYRANRRKVNAEGSQILVSTAVSSVTTLLEPLKAELLDARREAAEARREAAEVRRELSDMDTKARALMRALTQAQEQNAELQQTNQRLNDELARRRGRGGTP
jgi:septal ring factor EnvC (AmiA/AmiB activator)